MTLEEYIEQERKIRRGVHHHDGVWWVTTFPQCCQPLYQLQEIIPKVSAPNPWKAIIRYSHVVPKDYHGTEKKTRLLLQGDKLKSFDVKDLERRRRQAINKAIRSGFLVDKMVNLEKHWSDLQEIFISTARRTRYGLPERYYIEKEAEWRENLRREFDLPGRDWFGVYKGNKLIAYLYSCIVDGAAIWLATKSNGEYLKEDPNDLLWFHVISHYKAQAGCIRIDAGWAISQTPSIDWRKTKLGFERVEMPIFHRMNRFALLGVKALLSGMKPFLKEVRNDSRRNILHKLGVIENNIKNTSTEE